jgi:hypothetical protein
MKLTTVWIVSGCVAWSEEEVSHTDGTRPVVTETFHELDRGYSPSGPWNRSRNSWKGRPILLVREWSQKVLGVITDRFGGTVS